MASTEAAGFECLSVNFNNWSAFGLSTRLEGAHSMQSVTKRTTLITGASSGIGEEICRRLAAREHRVVNLSITAPPDDLPAESFIVDLADERQTSDILAKVIADYQVDHLVNNAGIAHEAVLEEIQLNHFQRLFDVHVRAALQSIQALAPRMKEQSYGRIVNMGSRTMLGKPGAASYAATKGALWSISRCFSLELAPHGVTVNMVAPGPTQTTFFDSVMEVDDPQMVALRDSIPIGRFAQVGDIAAAVEYFLQPDAGCVTGQTLYVCGGLSVSSSSP
ncbi:MAG: SDR family oxidoreductase [Pseudomonadota bacterium]